MNSTINNLLKNMRDSQKIEEEPTPLRKRLSDCSGCISLTQKFFDLQGEMNSRLNSIDSRFSSFLLNLKELDQKVSSMVTKIEESVVSLSKRLQVIESSMKRGLSEPHSAENLPPQLYIHNGTNFVPICTLERAVRGSRFPTIAPRIPYPEMQ